MRELVPITAGRRVNYTPIRGEKASIYVEKFWNDESYRLETINGHLGEHYVPRIYSRFTEFASQREHQSRDSDMLV